MDKTAKGILGRMRATVDPKYNVATGSYIDDILTPVALEFEKAYALAEANIKRRLISTSTGTDLQENLEEIGFFKKLSSYASGDVKLTGVPGASVAPGSLVAYGKVTYEISDEVLIGEDGTAVCNVVASLPGASGNAAPGKINYFPVTLTNITSVTNEGYITGGADEDTDDEYKARYYYFVDHPPISGNVYEYEQLALEADKRVRYAKAYEVWNGPGTVKVVIAGAELTPLGNDIVEIVTDYIEKKRVAGADVTVVSAETIPISVSADVTLESGAGIDDVTADFEEALKSYLKELGFKSRIVAVSQIGSILQGVEGVEFYTNLLINGAADNIEIPEATLISIGGVALE